MSHSAFLFQQPGSTFIFLMAAILDFLTFDNACKKLPVH
ncbi:unnamed protein product [Acanthoscelides obtectus]|uniref:Uncharacterized protein n=1 Tax=Acanthoscelides obtectus TaxID=200917 RepID=A0A9P0L907_ACAOB|nr:unnamed protein product [Acanthoscelides obtectus]CAK1672468.1 hypothetical protein AOBTE_LOCUS28916 [Acanthoscelides obtectus]